MGPQERFFAPGVQTAFLTEPFVLSPACDRMGVRLAGPILPVNAALTMPSEPVLRGSVQVAGDGVATVMLADPDRFTQQRSGDALRQQSYLSDLARAKTTLHQRLMLANLISGVTDDS